MKIDFPDVNSEGKPLRTRANLEALCDAYEWVMERDGLGNKGITHPTSGLPIAWRRDAGLVKSGSPMIDALERSGLPHETVAFHFYALTLQKEKRPDHDGLSASYSSYSS